VTAQSAGPGGPLDRGARPRGAARPWGPSAGMTLIEVVVAVTLLGLLSTALLVAFQMGAGAWQDARERLLLDRRISSANQILNRALACIVPVTAIPPRGSGVGRVPFFQGEPAAMRFVSSYSATEGARGGLNVYELKVVERRRGYRVLLNQDRYRGPRSVGRLITGIESDRPVRGRVLRFRPIEPRAVSLIIADDLRHCSFSYLWNPPMSRAEPEWRPLWNEQDLIPAAVTIDLAPLKREARLRPVSITVPIRAQFFPEAPQPVLRGF